LCSFAIKHEFFYCFGFYFLLPFPFLQKEAVLFIYLIIVV
jgi:hypothetical protein